MFPGLCYAFPRKFINLTLTGYVQPFDQGADYGRARTELERL